MTLVYVTLWWLLGFSSHIAGYLLFEDELLVGHLLASIFIGMLGPVVTVALCVCGGFNTERVVWRRK